ncbi:MAG: hypothetical protein U5R31_13200 [Acidimicrobiia bacterium]|nr:hypothetical protein [Acidimicrobiia bacterium]
MFELRFPAGQDVLGVQAFLGAVSGLLPPWWRRWWHMPFIGVEVHADQRGTQHRLLVPATLRRNIEGALAAHLPGVTYREIEKAAYAPLRLGAEYRLSSGERPLAVDAPVMSSRLLSSLQPLKRGEAVVVQTLLAPAATGRASTVGQVIGLAHGADSGWRGEVQRSGHRVAQEARAAAPAGDAAHRG